jgi:molecular chaperone DnaK
LDGIPPAPRGMPQVEVIFDIDANGILKVTAKDKATNREQKITIQGGTGLDKKEVEKMVQEAQKHADEDKKKKEQVEARNVADSLTYTAEKSLKDAGDKVPADVKKEIEDKVKAIRDNLQTASTDELKQKTQDLSNAMQKIGQYMYGSQNGQGQNGQPGQGPQGQPNQPGQGPNGNPNNDEPVEGEVL